MSSPNNFITGHFNCLQKIWFMTTRHECCIVGGGVHLREKSKKLPNGLNMLNATYEKVIKAMNALPVKTVNRIWINISS